MTKLRDGRRTRLPHLAMGLALIVAVSTNTAHAQCPDEPTLQHWTGGGTTAVPGFVVGEQWGSVFDSIPPEHFPIQVLRVGFGWGSLFGGNPDSLEQAINIYNGSLPNPGAPIFSLAGPVLTDGFINEFDLSALNVIVPSGSITATIQLANASTITGPAPVHDGNGCQSGKNVIFAIPGGWSNACSLGVTGDWQVHLVYRQVNCNPTNPTNYCTSIANSTGQASIMSSVGSVSVAANDLNLVASNVPAGNSAVPIYSPDQVETPLGNGNLCVGNSTLGFVMRLPATNADILGNVIHAFDNTSPPHPGGLVTPGSTWYFQIWYRDPAGGGSFFNFSDGLEVVFEP